MENKVNIENIKKTFLDKDFLSTKIICEDFLKNNTLNLEVIEIYGLALYNLKNFEKSIEQFNLLIKKNPSHPTAHLNIARIYKSLNKHEEAKKNYELALDRYPVLEEFYNEYANFLNQTGNKEECEKYLIKATKKNKKYPITFYNLSKFYLDQFDYSGSSLFLDRLLEFGPKDPLMLYEISKIHVDLQEYDKAKNILKKLISSGLKNINFYHSLIFLLLIENNKDEMRVYINKGKDIFGDDATLIYYESLIGDFDIKNYNIDEILNKAKKEKNLSNEFYINYSLFKFYEQSKDFDNASIYLKKANKIKRSEYKFYDNKKHLEQFTKLSDFFLKNFQILKEKSNTTKDYKPIFIIGMPRSGSSLIEQIICSHSKVYGSGEVSFFSNSLDLVLKPDEEIENFVTKLSKISKNDISKISDFYMRQTNFFNKDRKEFFTDKMLLNFKLLPLINICFPKAKIIHCERNPLDNCTSILKNNFENNFLPWSYDESELVNFYQIYKSVMINYKKLLKENIYEVNYDNFVKDSNEQIKKLLDYLSLDHEASCFEFFKNKRKVLTASAFQVREKIYASSVDSYKSYEKYFVDFFKKLKVC